MRSDKQIEKAVRVESAADEEVLRKIAADCGATVGTSAVRSPDPTSWLLIIGGSTIIVGTVIERWQDRRLGGQVIDLRPGADRVVHRDPGVVFGYVVVLLADGKVDIELHEPEHQLAALVSRVVDSGGSEQPAAEVLVERVVEIAQEVAGSDARISIDRTAIEPRDSGGTS